MQVFDVLEIAAVVFSDAAVIGGVTNVANATPNTGTVAIGSSGFLPGSHDTLLSTASN